MASEVTALEHEIRDHTVERGTSIAKTVLAGRELPKVSCSFGDDFVVQFEDDSTSISTIDLDVELGDQEVNMSRYDTRIDVQERRYIDVVGHWLLW